MKRRIRMWKAFCRIVVLAFLSSGYAAQATTFDVAADFSATNNPNGVWSYGWSSTLTSALNLYPDKGKFDPTINIDVWFDWGLFSSYSPNVAHNPTGSINNDHWTITWQPGQFSLHPGDSGEYSHARWTAPDAGTIDITSMFTGIDHYFGTTTDVHVLHNGISLFDGEVIGYGDTSSFSTTALNVGMGDRIDFTVGYGSNQNPTCDTTALSATISFIPEPEPLTGRIAFYTEGRIFIMNADGTSRYEVPLPYEQLPIVQVPQWSPDGEWLTFHGATGHNGQIYIVRPDGSGFHRVTDGSGNLVNPSFSPDGSQVAFHRVYGHLYTINTDGTGLTDHGVNVSHSRWSPDGRYVAYTNWGFGSYPYRSDVFVYDFTTGNSTQITHHTADQAFIWVAWSPDGTKLAVSVLDWTTVQSDIWVMNADGSDPRNLTTDWTMSSEDCSSWSPDGEYIVFQSDRSGNLDIWYTHVDHFAPINITNSPEIDEYGPDWGVSEPVEPNIAVSPLSHDFGDVELGTSSTVVVTISNVGDGNLNVSGIALETDFAITSAPATAVIVEPNKTVDVEITYTPSVLGDNSAVLKITSDDPDEPVVEVQLSATGVEIPPPPSEQIANILAFFNTSVDGGTLVGDGPGSSAEKRLNALRNMVEAAGSLIDDELSEESCQQLLDVYRRMDGQPRPPDFVKGEAVPELATMIQELMTSLGCE